MALAVVCHLIYTLLLLRLTVRTARQSICGPVSCGTARSGREVGHSKL